MLVTDAVAIVGTFLFASVSFPQLLARAYGVDLHRVGTRNLGGGNLTRAVDPVVGISGGILDALKPPFAILFGAALGADDAARIASAVVAVAAQQWPLWHRFDGGRGNAPAFAVFLVLSLRASLLVAPLLLLGAGRSFVQRRRGRSAGAVGTPFGVLVAFVAYPVVALALGEPSTVVAAGAATTALIVLRRLTAGVRADLRSDGDVASILRDRLLFDRGAAQRRLPG